MRWLVAMAAVLWAGQAAAEQDYEACLAMVAVDAEAAERAASTWTRDGGGAPAQHCRALALIELGARATAIDALLDLAAEAPLPPRARADILVHAGDLLLEEGDTITAEVAAQQAMSIEPGHTDALVLRAGVRAETGRLDAALADIELALKRAGPAPRIILLRAAARRRASQLVAARADAAWATELTPEDAAAWLERGRIEDALGDPHAARSSFLTAIDLDREGPIGRTAQQTLQRMDAGVD